ncbi:hypothetical protein GCM10012275_53850 [Longimycelium tulufanense]|uniref:Uncharacterized protein n=1 Tax=Longimycelium tulufanense TaxID=907463 RepID=A0A8J3CH29_9PSEU|nr:hypothetical protein [Longimycelium tulufanense]GGM76312.1 hypothetical protein GCM10012275_53850 [Longimycelium tulufanense]
MDPKVIEVTDAEIRIIRAALRHYLAEFGHEEADILRDVKKLIARLPEADASPKPTPG